MRVLVLVCVGFAGGTGPLRLGRYARPHVRAGWTPLACHHRAYEKAVPVVR